MNKRRAGIILLFFLLFACGVCYISYKIYNDLAQIRSERFLLEERRKAFRELETRIENEKGQFAGQAGIVVKDLRTGWECVLNRDVSFPSASLAKIPVMAVCFYAAEKDGLDLEEKIRLKPADRVAGSGVLKGSPVGTELTILRLIELMIAESDNTAANMLIDRLGFDYIKRTIPRLGLRHTNVDRHMMDFKKRKEGVENYSTAGDIEFLLDSIYHGRLINKKISDLCMSFLKKQKLRDRIPALLPSDTVVAHKTGLERGICHDAGILFLPQGDMLISVLTRHKDTTSRRAKRFIARTALIAYTYCQNN